MDKRVAQLNIEHYRRLLAAEPEGPKRQTLLRLLAEEEAKPAHLTRFADSPAKRHSITTLVAIPAEASARCQFDGWFQR